MRKQSENIKTFEEHLVEQYGGVGTKSRLQFDKGFEAFKLGIIIREARKARNISQRELAVRSKTKESFISRIENDASDIRLSTLMRIIEKGLGGRLHISVDF
ncbi:MAG TPA: helix-turn-helix transcriptional regulator [Bacteroidota bacterium]